MTPSPLPRATPAAVGLSGAGVRDFLDAVEARGLDLHAFSLVRHGRVAAEGAWSPHRPQHRHSLYSLTKSFTAVGALFAVQEGLLSLDDPVLRFFPRKAPKTVGPFLADLKVRHLLTMTMGRAGDSTTAVTTCRDWVRTLLGLPWTGAPGTRFVYDSMASHLVSEVVHAVAGVNLRDWLVPRLFSPLGIVDPPWDQAPGGATCGGWGLYLNSDEVARFGQFLLQEGRWEGQSLLDPVLVAEAVGFHIATGTKPDHDGHQGYGYQFWRCRHGAYRGDGAFGQLCVVSPDHDLVAVFLSGIQDSQPLLDLVWRHLLPGAPGEDQTLAGRMVGLVRHPHALGEDPGAAWGRFEAWEGRSWSLEGHPRGWTAVGFGAGRTPSFWYRDDRGTHRAPFGWGTWVESRGTLWRHDSQKRRTFVTLASARWEAQDRLVLTLRFPEQAPEVDLDFTRSGDDLVLFQRNSVFSGAWTFPQVVGRPL